jgi:hypothetical protein
LDDDMPPQPSPPALCRLCRRPLVLSAVKCPACGARQAWDDRTRGIAVAGRRRGWRGAGYVALGAIVIAAAVVWVVVLREVKAPVLSDGGVTNAARPTSAECAQLASELASRRKSDQPIAPDTGERLRQCFKGR